MPRPLGVEGAQLDQGLVFHLGGFGQELFPAITYFEQLKVGDDIGQVAGRWRRFEGGQILDALDRVVVLVDPSIFGSLPVIQRLPDFLLPSFKHVPYALSFGVDELGNFLLLGGNLFSHRFKCSLRLRNRMRHRCVSLAAFASFEVGQHFLELVDLCSHLVKPRVKPVRLAVDGQCGFCGRHCGQFGICGHGESLPRCSQRLKVVVIG
ncbi:hypothetical protein D3C84_766370 [compost metagenome]